MGKTHLKGVRNVLPQMRTVKHSAEMELKKELISYRSSFTEHLFRIETRKLLCFVKDFEACVYYRVQSAHIFQLSLSLVYPAVSKRAMIFKWKALNQAMGNILEGN